MRTLLIIDVQNDFTPGGALAVPNGDLIIPTINQLQRKFDLVLATQDWHPSNHISFASNHPSKKPFEEIKLEENIHQTLWPNHCIQNSWGAEFHPHLETQRIEAIFRKGMDFTIDSYSGFYDNGHKKKTGLSGYLRDKGCTNIHFCGLAADYCVYYSVKDALAEGFSPIIVEDAVKSISDENYKDIKEELIKKNVQFVHSHKLIF